MRITSTPLLLTLSLLLLAGCVTVPQNTEEARRYIASMETGTVDQYSVARPFDEVVGTIREVAPECLNVEVKTTEAFQQRMGINLIEGQKVTIVRYRPTLNAGPDGAEFYTQMKYEVGAYDPYHTPQGGHFVFVVDLFPAGPQRTDVAYYHSTDEYYDPLTNAVKGWISGDALGCPDMTAMG